MREGRAVRKGSTQAFTEVKDIVEDVVFLTTAEASLLIEVQATNFSLLGKQEQDARIFAYAQLLNSLSFPIQIVVRNKQINLSSYVELLDEELKKESIFSSSIQKYRDFVQSLVTVRSVLDKKFYIIIPYSPHEKGTEQKAVQAVLHTKAEILLSQLSRLGVRANVVEKEKLLSLFFTIYNEGAAPSMLSKRGVSVADLIAPSSVEIDFRSIRIGERFFRTLFIVDYPRFVSPNWLLPLIDFDHSMDISMFIYPTTSSDILGDLKRKIAEMEATLTSSIEEGQLVDPKVKATLEDALALQEELAKGVERFFQFSLYLTVGATSQEELEEASRKLLATMSSLLLIGKTATLEMEKGLKSTIPQGTDRLYLIRNMDTTSLATTFPFSSATLTQDKGVLYGVNAQNNSLVIFDRFSLENANEVVLGKSGSGKSYLIKLEIMRQFIFGTEVIVVDPEGEYEALSKILAGEYVSFSSTSPIAINPFDLSGLYEEGENELGLKILSLHALLRVIMGDLSPSQDAILDRALVATYHEKGITQDPQTQTRQPPILDDLYRTLLGMEDPLAKELALRLERFITGSLAGLFNKQSNFNVKNPLTVFSIKALEEELRPIAMHIILDFVWTRIRKTLKKRILVLDEAWYMMKYKDSASFVYGIAKRARKYYLGLTTVTQDVEDFLATEYGKAVLSNSSLQLLLKQGAAEIDIVAKTFYLSGGEKQMLLSSSIGEGLLFAGQSHVAIRVVAAPFEHELVTSKPEELLARQPAPQKSRPPVPMVS